MILKGDAATPQSVTNNGTVSFVDTGKTQLLVTCAHVIESYKEKKQSDPSMILSVGLPWVKSALTIRDEWIIECGNKKLDLATIQLPRADVIEEMGKRYFPAGSWPLSRIPSDGIAEVAGFQGEHRRVLPEGLEANISYICSPINSLSDRHFALQIEEANHRIVKVNPNLADIGALGGMSGGAAFSTNSGGIRELVGFVYSGDWITEKDAIIYVLHADLIREDGKLNWGALA